MRTLLTLLLTTGAAATLSADWPMWGGTPDRNMVSPHEGRCPRVGCEDRQEREVGGRARDRSPTATRSVGGGVVLVGTNNELPCAIRSRR
jgi:hypothetical protein